MLRISTLLLSIAMLNTNAASAADNELPIYLDGEVAVQVITPPSDQSAPTAERSVFYQVSYPKDWKDRGLSDPMCAPCDHLQDGVQWTDFHDHLVTRPDVKLRHVFNIKPAYTGDENLDVLIVDAYAAQLPITNTVDANALISLRLATGERVAELDNYGFYYPSEIKK